MLTLVPTNGEDFTSKATILTALIMGTDFKIMDMSSPWDGKPANLESLQDAGEKTLKIRFRNHTKVAMIDISGPIPK